MKGTRGCGRRIFFVKIVQIYRSIMSALLVAIVYFERVNCYTWLMLIC